VAVDQARLTQVIEDATAFLRGRIRVAAVYLFGSQLTGDTHEFSDIDLGVFSPDVQGMDLMSRVRLSTDLQMACSGDLQPHLFPEWALHDPPAGSFAEHVIKTGKRIV